MIQKALEYLVGLGSPTIHKTGGREYADRALHLLGVELPEPLALTTLTSMVEYISQRCDPPRDGGLEMPLLLRVAGPAAVVLQSALLRPYAVREKLALSNPILPAHPFGHWYDQESFLIWLLTAFVPDESTAALARVVGTLRDHKVLTLDDDGVTQQVTVSAGVVRSAVANVPNPIPLRPYRTFHEVEQPASLFVLRLRQANEGALPTMALFEVDDGRWRVEAVERIAAWLRDELVVRGAEDKVHILA